MQLCLTHTNKVVQDFSYKQNHTFIPNKMLILPMKILHNFAFLNDLNIQFKVFLSP